MARREDRLVEEFMEKLSVENMQACEITSEVLLDNSELCGMIDSVEGETGNRLSKESKLAYFRNMAWVMRSLVEMDAKEALDMEQEAGKWPD